MINWERPSPIQLNQPHAPHFFIISRFSCCQTYNERIVSVLLIENNGLHYLVATVFRIWASGAATKQVKCRLVFISSSSFKGCRVCPRAELCRWILVKTSVDSRSLPHSSGVLPHVTCHFCGVVYYRVFNVP